MIDSDGLIVEKPVTRRIQFTAQARGAHVQHYLNSDQTMSTYCDQHNIPLSTFKAWVSKYSRKKAFGFIPVRMQSKPTPTNKVLSPPAVQQHRQQRLEIYCKDIKVVLPDICDLDMVNNIIKAMLLCD